MNKREFVIQFVLNRASAGHIITDGPFWVKHAVAAWNEIQNKAPTEPAFPPEKGPGAVGASYDPNSVWGGGSNGSGPPLV